MVVAGTNLLRITEEEKGPMAYSCSQCDQGCQGSTNCFCFACGLPVCKVCSDKVDYHDYGKKRLCINCQDEESKMVEVPLRRRR